MQNIWAPRSLANMGDLARGLFHYPLWSYLGWNDIRQRYRRSVLGPFWLTISAGVIVFSVGLLYGTLFNQPLHDYLPWFAVSFVSWIFIFTTLTEASYAIISSENFIRQTNLPITTYVIRVVWRNLIILGHNLVVVLMALAFGQTMPGFASLLFIPGMALLVAFLLGLSVILAIVCTRFRDLPMLVSSALQLLFYVTPILWKQNIIPDRYWWVVEFNPLFHLFELVRAPALGHVPELRHVVVSLAVTVVTYACALLLLARTRHRIAYWL